MSDFLPPHQRLLSRARAKLLRTVSLPANWLPGGDSRFVDSWRSDGVAEQMLRLTESQLREPERVAPYRIFRDMVAAILRDGALPEPATFLDIGCGIGAYGDLLDRYAPGRFLYLGADFSSEIIAAARRHNPQRRFERRDLLQPGSIDGFDVVLASALLDVLPNVDEGLDRIVATDAPWLILHRQRIARRPSVRITGGYSRQSTYRSSLTLRLLQERAEQHGRRLVMASPVEGSVYSFLLVRPPGDRPPGDG